MDRSELERRLRELYVSHQDTSAPWDKECGYCQERMNKVMALIDSYTEALTSQAEPLLWTADRVAGYLGLRSADGARAVLSKAGIKAYDHRVVPGNSRPCAMYRVDEVEKLAKTRVPRPRRTNRTAE